MKFVESFVISCISGLPGPPEDCHVTRETNESLTVLCSPGWSGGLKQTFHLGNYYISNIKRPQKYGSVMYFWMIYWRIIPMNKLQDPRGRALRATVPHWA